LTLTASARSSVFRLKAAVLLLIVTLPELEDICC